MGALKELRVQLATVVRKPRNTIQSQTKKKTKLATIHNKS